MLTVLHAGALSGIDAIPVEVEIQFTKGLPCFDLIGLSDTAVRESRVRVKTALEQNGWEVPKKRLLVNLAPGDVKKRGTAFDLPIALGILAAGGRCARDRFGDTLVLGELGLSGEVRPVRGVLAQLRSAAARGLRSAVVPAANADEAALAVDIEVRCAATLRDAVAHFEGEAPLPVPEAPPRGGARTGPDLAEVRGQEAARRALEISAAGEHHVLLVGPPGTGKTMLARRLPTILPAPTPEEALDIATVFGVAGLPFPRTANRVGRPFRAPHYSASAAALVGGGMPVRPGEVTLAHGGVLFLDELPELRRDAIESLRSTMEAGVARIARVHERVSMPARPLVVAAMNPCPCGYAGDDRRVCQCSPDRVERYRGRVSGPLLDRFDMHVAVPRVPTRALRRIAPGESSEVVRARVCAARARGRARGPVRTIRDLTAGVAPRALRLLDRAVDQLGLSARAWVKVLRLAWTIADLADRGRVTDAHVAEAVQYRLLDRDRSAADARSA